MLTLRRQLPVYSPIRFRSLLDSCTGALGFGRPLGRLHRLLTERYGTTDHLLTDSGTSALRLAIEGALAIGRDAESGKSSTGSSGGGVVALPAYCCPDVATAAVGAGARVCLYDIDPETLGPDWKSLEDALRSGVEAIVVAHLYGIPIDISRANRLADAYGALVIEDAAQGFGGRIGERPLGALGSLGVLSFGRGKGITGGGGGALLANDTRGRTAMAAVDASLARGTAGWRELFRLTAQWFFGRPALYGLPSAIPWLRLGETRYHEPWPPRKISSGAAAAVPANWEASSHEAVRRREHARRLAEQLGLSVTLPEPGGESSVSGALRQAVVLDDGHMPDGLPASVRAAGIERGYPELSGLPALQQYAFDVRSHPGAACLARRLFTLPTHSFTTPRKTGRMFVSWRKDE